MTDSAAKRTLSVLVVAIRVGEQRNSALLTNGGSND
jgi:hypothetical protein